MKNILKKKERIIILGSGGFISSEVEKKLNQFNINFVPIKRSRIDLTKKNSIKKLSKIIKFNDSLLFIAANAPVKNEKMLINNLKMAQTLCEVIKKTSPSFILYVSSDAVYSDIGKKINESSPVQPNSIHGVMHYSREIMLKNVYKGKLCIVRPTLIFGKNDPHNGYGPNQFVKSANKSEDIKIFGNGEELRDHIWVNDVAYLISRLILMKKEGIYNLVTGQVTSFKKIADIIVSNSTLKRNLKIIKVKRNGPMPHNGWRAFSNKKIKKIFPAFKFKSLKEVMSSLIKL